MPETKSYAPADAERGAAVDSDTGSHVRSREPRVEGPARDQEPTRMVTYESVRDGQIAQDETRAKRRKLPGREMGWDEDDASTYVYATLESEQTPHAPRSQPCAPSAVRAQQSVPTFDPAAPRALSNAQANVASLRPAAAPARSMPVPAAQMPRPTPTPTMSAPTTTRVDRRAITHSTAAVSWLPVHEPAARAALLRKLVLAAVALGGAALAIVGVQVFTGAPATSTVQLMTEPVDAEVTLDGVLAHGSASPFVLSEVKLNVAHTIVVSKAGYRSWSTRLTLRSERPVLLPNVQLTRESSVAEPLIVPTRYAAPPSLPGRPAPAIPERVSPASQVASRAGFALRTRPPARAASRVQPSVSTRVPRQGLGVATLRINSRPWSQVYVDGRLIGATPQTQIVLAAGAHTVTLINPDFGLKRVIALPLEPGQTVTKLVDLSH